MTTDRGATTTATSWVAGHRRTIAAGVCLVVSAVACAGYVARPRFEAGGTALVVANPVYVAADAAAVAPHALTSARTLRIPAGASVAVEPGPAAVLRITVTAQDAVTAQDTANDVLDVGLPAALRMQVAEGLRLRRAAGARTPARVTAADIDATLARYRLRVVTATRARGTTPSGAEAVQAVAVAQIGGLPAARMDLVEASRLVADAVQGGTLDAVRGDRAAAVEVRATGGPAVRVTVAAGSEEVAGAVARDVTGAASAQLERLLRSSGLPAETLVLQPYVAPVAVAARTVPPWWFGGLLLLVALASAGAVRLDRRDRRSRSGRPDQLLGGASRRSHAAGQQVPARAEPLPQRLPGTVPLPPAVPAAAQRDWSPLRISEWSGASAIGADSDAVAVAGNLPRSMSVPVVRQVADGPLAEGVGTDGAVDPGADPGADPAVDPGADPGPAAGPSTASAQPAPGHPVSVVDLRTRIFGDDDTGETPVAPAPGVDGGPAHQAGGEAVGGPHAAADRARAADHVATDHVATDHVATDHGVIRPGGPSQHSDPAVPGATVAAGPPRLRPTMPGSAPAGRPAGDPTSFAPPTRSVLVESPVTPGQQPDARRPFAPSPGLAQAPAAGPQPEPLAPLAPFAPASMTAPPFPTQPPIGQPFTGRPPVGPARSQPVVPGQSAPGQSAPGQSAPGQSAPGQQVPGQQIPGEQVLDPEPADQPWSDILGSDGGAPRRSGRTPKLRGGRR